jgi:hypothetical protein
MRLAEIEGELVSNLLEKNLGFYNFGKHTKQPGDAGFAFEKIGDLWNEEITAELNLDDRAELNSNEKSDIEQDEMKTDKIEQTQSCQDQKRSRRNQTEETKTAAKRAKGSDHTKTTSPLFLKKLWKDTQESADKMFLT